MTITCPHCYTECEGSPDLVGTEVRCPNCRHEFIAGNLAEHPTRPMMGSNTPPACVKTAGRLIVINLILAFAFQLLYLMSGLFEGYGVAYIARSGIWFVMKILVYGIVLFVVRRILAGSSLARSVLNVVGVIALFGSLPELGRLLQPTSDMLLLGAVIGLITSVLLLVAIVLVNQTEANEWFKTMKEARKHSMDRSKSSKPSAYRSKQSQDVLVVESDDSIERPAGSANKAKLFYIIVGLAFVGAVLCLFAVFDPFSLFERKPGDIRSVSINGTRFDFAWCPPGSFMMGSPDFESGRHDDEIRHLVTLTKGFWIGTTEVSQGQWKSLMNWETIDDIFRNALHDDRQYDFRKGTKTFREDFGVARNADPRKWCCDLVDDIPVYYVGWNEAARFCSALTEHERSANQLPDGYEYRLPTEAEWEYACRAGTASALPNGKNLSILGENNAPELDSISWYGGNSSQGFHGQGWDTSNWKEKQCSGGSAAPRRVAQKEPNNWGVYDMIGNVWEWTNDRYASYSRNNVTNPVGGRFGTYRVIRGGAWDMPAARCRSAFRASDCVGLRQRNLGFRVVLAPVLTQ